MTPEGEHFYVKIGDDSIIVTMPVCPVLDYARKISRHNRSISDKIKVANNWGRLNV
ncbi:MAG: hypothetical protein ACOX0L_04935 [Natronincolaceae bacterium]